MLFTAVFALVLTAFASALVHLAFVLFGAPLLTHVSQTLLLSAHFSLLTLFPIFYVRGVESAAWRAVASATAPLDEVYGALVGAVAGAWLGAVPIPLDWDREWQKWPVTIVAGMYAGYVLGKVAGGTVLYGRRLASVETAEQEQTKAKKA